MKFGAGNQMTALRASRMNTAFRLQVTRGAQYWEIAEEVRPIAAANRNALNAAKAAITAGGNCGEHAALAYEFLRYRAVGQQIARASVNDLDHAFVVIGDAFNDTDSALTVCDPWPTDPTACLWEDHFAFADRSQLNPRDPITADGQNVMKVIQAGLKLTAEGQRLLNVQYTEEQTEEAIQESAESDHGWIWNHPDSVGVDFQTRERREYEYFVADSESTPEAEHDAESQTGGGNP